MAFAGKALLLPRKSGQETKAKMMFVHNLRPHTTAWWGEALASQAPAHESMFKCHTAVVYYRRAQLEVD